jgi:uncharacterized protein
MYSSSEAKYMLFTRYNQYAQEANRTMADDEIQIKAEQSFAFLANQKYILLKTFRKSGVAVPTAVWFAHNQGKLYMMTGRSAGKVKRIRNNQSVLLAPCDSRGKVLGAEVQGQAHVLSDDKATFANTVLARKYGFLYQIFTFAEKIRKTPRVFIEIVPA